MIAATIVTDAGAGTGAVAKLVRSTDSSGYITIRTGSSPTQKTGLLTVVFHKPLPSSTAVCLIPMSMNARRYFLPTTRTQFVLMVDGEIEPYTNYAWQYKVGQACFDWLDGRR